MVSKCAKCVIKLLEFANGRRRNFILDQVRLSPLNRQQMYKRGNVIVFYCELCWAVTLKSGTIEIGTTDVINEIGLAKRPVWLYTATPHNARSLMYVYAKLISIVLYVN